MNLRAIANSLTSTINPNIPATLLMNQGYITSVSGKRTESFIEEPVTLQIQSLSAHERQEFDGLLQQGQMLNVYITGQLHVLRRIQGKGAERLRFVAFGETEPSEWLVKSLTESWASWCKVVVWRQH